MATVSKNITAKTTKTSKKIEDTIVKSTPKAAPLNQPAQDYFFSNFTTTKVLYGLLIGLSFFLGYFYAKSQFLETNKKEAQVQAAQQAAGSQQPQQPQGKVDVANGNLAVLGDKNAKVTIVEFSDFQCPFCRSFFNDTFSQIKKDYIDTGKVKIAFRNFPLPFHPAAQPAALAAECANEQGKFWEYHDKMFEEQNKEGNGTVEFTKDDLKSWAAALGLETGKFNQCLDSEKYKDSVSKDLSDGQKAGVNGTPAFFVNGTSIVGAQPYQSFKELIDKELNSN